MTLLLSMCFVFHMVTFANDNERETFSPISLAAAMILNRLRTQRHLLELQDEKKIEPDGNSGDASDEQREIDQREAVNEGLRRIRAFERRASGHDASRRKRP